MRSHKICSRCRLHLPLTSFDRCASMSDGRHAYCHPCKLAYDRERRALRPPKRKTLHVTPEARAFVAESQAVKTCKGCKRRKLLRFFPVVPRASGLPATAARCKACEVERVLWHRRARR